MNVTEEEALFDPRDNNLDLRVEEDCPQWTSWLMKYGIWATTSDCKIVQGGLSVGMGQRDLKNKHVNNA